MHTVYSHLFVDSSIWVKTSWSGTQSKPCNMYVLVYFDRTVPFTCIYRRPTIHAMHMSKETHTDLQNILLPKHGAEVRRTYVMHTRNEGWGETGEWEITTELEKEREKRNSILNTLHYVCQDKAQIELDICTFACWAVFLTSKVAVSRQIDMKIKGTRRNREDRVKGCGKQAIDEKPRAIKHIVFADPMHVPWERRRE